MRKLLKEREPVDHDGKVWQMTDAFIGNGGKDKQPEVITMGGGPRLIDASRCATPTAGPPAPPFVYAEPQKYAEAVTGHKKTLEELGRGDDDFSFGLHHIVFICEDKDDFERHVDNPLVKWYSRPAAGSISATGARRA